MTDVDTSLEFAVLLSFVREPDEHTGHRWRVWRNPFCVVSCSGRPSSWVMEAGDHRGNHSIHVQGFSAILKTFQDPEFRARHGLERPDE